QGIFRSFRISKTGGVSMHKKSLGCLVLLVISLCPPPVLGQADVSTATLKGAITDPNGAAVVGAAVSAISSETGIKKSTTTGQDGSYKILLLQPGIYQLQVEAQGFEKVVAQNVQLTVGQSLVYDVSLRLGAITSVVNVTADAPLLQVEQTQQANTINKLQVENLPNINRSMTAAVFTLPGVSNSEATRSQQPGFTGFATTGFSIGGSNGRNNLSTIDGGENEYGSGQYRVASIPVDAIQEFQVNRNAFSAEFGFTVGSSVNIVTKSGTNQLHGSAYGYFRDHFTQANNFIDNLRGTGELYSQNVITGGTIGGPVIKNKLFFFASYEFVKSDLGAFNFLLNSPSSLGINGGTSAGVAQQNYLNLLANSGNATLAAVAAPLRTGLVPQNNPHLLKMLTRDDGAYNNLTKTHTLITRADWQPSAKDTMNFRFELARGLFGAQTYPDGASLKTRDYSILGSWSRVISPTLVNQLRVQVVPYNKADNLPNIVDGSIANPSPNLPPAITIAGFSIGGFVPSFNFGSPAAIPYIAHQQRYQFEDTISWTHRSHSFKFGASYRPVNYNVEDDLYFAGQFNFADNTYPIILAVPPAQRAAVAGYNLTHNISGGNCQTAPPCIGANGPPAASLTGAQLFTFGLPSFYHQGFNNPKWQGWAHYFGSFAQDSWKVSSKLTLDFGARIDLDSEPTPLHRNTYVY